MLTNAQKIERYNFAKTNLNLQHLGNWVFADETSIESHHIKKYHMRKKSSRPRCIGIYKRDRFKINVWGAISMKGAAKFVVNKKFYLKYMYR